MTDKYGDAVSYVDGVRVHRTTEQDYKTTMEEAARIRPYILSDIKEGYSNIEIAARRGVSQSTVRRIRNKHFPKDPA